MSTSVQNVDYTALHYLKIIQYLEEHNVQPIINNNGTLSFKRHTIDNQNAYQYLYAKCIKNLNIRTKDQLDTLMNTLSNELKLIKVDFRDEIKGVPTKRLSDHKQYVKVRKTLEEIYNNYVNKREQFIFSHGIVTKSLKMPVDKYKFYPKPYGYIDYYNGIIIASNLNLNSLGNILIKNNKKEFTSNSSGLISIPNDGYVVAYDTKHYNTTFKHWICKDNKCIQRLYFKIGNETKYIPLRSDNTNFITIASSKIPQQIKRHRIIDKYE